VDFSGAVINASAPSSITPPPADKGPEYAAETKA